MAPRENHKSYANIHTPWLRPIVTRKSGALALHWLFQGLLYMDPTERWFKLGLDLLLTLVLGGILRLWLALPLAIGGGFAVAHSLNFLFNGQMYGVLKTFGTVSHSGATFNAELERLRARVTEEPCILYAAAYGSLARGEWSETSDLDVRVVRAPGFRSAWRVCWFAARERARAFLKRFPLDIYVLDGHFSLEKMSEKSIPIVLINDSGQASEQR
jgi:predicted nucleotidyltransferase